MPLKSIKLKLLKNLELFFILMSKGPHQKSKQYYLTYFAQMSNRKMLLLFFLLLAKNVFSVCSQWISL